MYVDQNLDLSPDTLSAANICPQTGLATDYLNHFNEVAMLLDMISSMPEVEEEVLEWMPATYVEHFEHSGFRDKALAIAAYNAAPSTIIDAFKAACREVEATIIGVQALVREQRYDEAEMHAKEIYDLIAAVNGVILGGNVNAVTELEDDSAQSAIDALFD